MSEETKNNDRQRTKELEMGEDDSVRECVSKVRIREETKITNEKEKLGG